MSGSPFGILEYFSGKKASEAQVESADKATDIQLQMFNQTRADQAPWRVAGGAAVNKLMPMLAKGPGEFVPANEPGYKFGYEEFVEKPSLRLASATGKLGSGATLKALTRYASDYASTKYDNFLDRWYKSLDPYYRVAGLGSNVAIGGGNQAVATGQSVANSLLAAGEGQAAGILGSYGAASKSMGNVGNALGNYFTNKNWGSSGYDWGNTVAGSAEGANSMIWLGGA